MSEKTLDQLAEKALEVFDEKSINVSEIPGGYEVSVDDSSETYNSLIDLGKGLKPDATDQEAFELALHTILNTDEI